MSQNGVWRHKGSGEENPSHLGVTMFSGWTAKLPRRDNAAASGASGGAAALLFHLPSQQASRFMADDDFDVAALAAYLHMMPAQVSRLAERGKLPGRRIAGAWRFSRPEIGQWLEQRIGLSDDDELAAMETNLERTDLSGSGDVDLAELLAPEAVAIPLDARTSGSVIARMCVLAGTTGRLWDAAKMAEAVTAREAMAPTTLDNGVALLHPRRPQASILGQALIALGVTSQGIPFAGARGGLTDVFFLLAATSDHEHLRILARISRIVNDAEWLASLRAAPDAAAARRLVLDRDAAIGR